MRVWLIGSFHEERGLTNAANLEIVLERIRPEVIFVECPPWALDEVLNGTRRSVEFDAVRSYSRKHDVDLLPVDLPTPPASFFRDGADLFRAIERVSSHYRELIDLNGREVAAHGFPYLNSERCSQLWTDAYEAMRLAVEQLADRRLIELHHMWTTTHHRRDEAMLKGIEDYSKKRRFEVGALLVGAAHRRTILARSRGSQAGALPIIEWDLSNFLNPAE